MKKKPFNPRRNPIVHVTACSALAVLLAIGPPSYNSDSGTFSFPAAHAESSCFVPGTLILMADGRQLPIEQVRPGDRVLGADGQINRVTGIERVPLGSRKLYALNGGKPFVTAEHPFMTRTGWKSASPAATAQENPRLSVGSLAPGDYLVRAAMHSQVGLSGNLAQEQALELVFDEVLLETLAASAAAPELILYNLLLDGNHSYIADGYLVHNKGGDDGGDSGGGDSSGSGSGGDDGDDDSSGSGSGGDDDDDSSGSGSGDDDDDDSSGSGSGDDDDDDSIGSGSDDDGDDDSSGSDKSGDDDRDDQDRQRADDDRDDDSRGRGRGRGEHALDDDDDSGRPSEQDERRGDRVRTRSDVRSGTEGTPDFRRDRSRLEQQFDAQGNLISETLRTETRIGDETTANFQRDRSQTTRTFDASGNLVSEQVSTDNRLGPEDSPEHQRDRTLTIRAFDEQGNLISEQSNVRSQTGPDDDQDNDDSSRSRSSSSFIGDDLSPSGPDLSPDEEAAAIRSGWTSN